MKSTESVYKYLVKTPKKDYLFDKDLLILVAWLDKGFDFVVKNPEIKLMERKKNNDGRFYLHYELKPLKSKKTTDKEIKYRLYPIKYPTVWKDYGAAVDILVNNKESGTYCVSAIKRWMENHDVISITACPEMTFVKGRDWDAEIEETQKAKTESLRTKTESQECEFAR